MSTDPNVFYSSMRDFLNIALELDSILCTFIAGIFHSPATVKAYQSQLPDSQTKSEMAATEVIWLPSQSKSMTASSTSLDLGLRGELNLLEMRLEREAMCDSVPEVKCEL